MNGSAHVAPPPAAATAHSTRTNYTSRDASDQAVSGLRARDHSTVSSPASTKPAPAPAAAPAAAKPAPKYAPVTVHRDVRSYLPPVLSRFLGLRTGAPPFAPLPFPPFSWLRHLPLKYEVWLLSFIGSFVGIALIEIVAAAGFTDDGTIMIVASFGASAVLSFGTIEAPLAQPRNLVGGQVVSAIVGVCLTRLFRKATGYHLSETTHSGDLGRVVWLNGALSMAVALLAMQITGTVHPPGGATAIIASVQPAAVAMSWRLIYLVLISALIMLGWACIINNVGRRRYPTYWLHGDKVFVKPPEKKDVEAVYEDELRLAAVEGRSDGFGVMERAMSSPSAPNVEKTTPPSPRAP